MERPATHPFSDEGRAHELSKSMHFRRPVAADGVAVHDLIARCPPLDANSVYCNLLQTSHHADTCVIAERDRRAVGWVSAYVLPSDPHCLFVWQVAVAPEARGHRLGQRMIRQILERDVCRAVTRIHTTITETNVASWSLFQRLADDLAAPLARCAGFESNTHFAGRSPTEILVEIGPLYSSPSGG